MNKKITYPKSQGRLVGQIYKGERWITDGHWGAREEYVRLHEDERVSSAVGKGVFAMNGDLLRVEGLAKVLDPGLARGLVRATVTSIISYNPDGYSARVVAPANGKGPGLLIQEKYLCELFMGLEAWFKPKSPYDPVFFKKGDELHGLIMPVRIQNSTALDLFLAAAAVKALVELEEKLRRNGNDSRTRLQA